MEEVPKGTGQPLVGLVEPVLHFQKKRFGEATDDSVLLGGEPNPGSLDFCRTQGGSWKPAGVVWAVSHANSRRDLRRFSTPNPHANPAEAFILAE